MHKKGGCQGKCAPDTETDASAKGARGAWAQEAAWLEGDCSVQCAPSGVFRGSRQCERKPWSESKVRGGSKLVRDKVLQDVTGGLEQRGHVVMALAP